MIERHHLRAEFWRVVRFGLVGLFNTLFYTAMFLFLLHVAGVRYWVAAPVAFVIAACVAYLLTHRFTFRASTHSRGLVIQFFLVQGIATVVNVVALAFTVETLGWSPTVGQFAVLPPVVATTFVLQRFVVFRKHVDGRLVGAGEAAPSAGRDSAG